MNEIDASLRWQLRALQREVEPAHDLWPGIAERIAGLPQQQVQTTKSQRRNWLPLAMAASLVLAIGVIWQSSLLPQRSQPVVQREAASLTRDYQTALVQFKGLPPHAELADALKELDDSALQIRAAIQRDPHSRFLLDQLRRTYTQRLNLTQRAVMS